MLATFICLVEAFMGIFHELLRSCWQRQSKNHSWILIHRLLMWRQSTALQHNKDSVLVLVLWSWPLQDFHTSDPLCCRPPTAYQRPQASVHHRQLLSQIFHIYSFIHSLNIHRFRTFRTIISRQWKSKDAPHIYIITHRSTFLNNLLWCVFFCV